MGADQTYEVEVNDKERIGYGCVRSDGEGGAPNGKYGERGEKHDPKATRERRNKQDAPKRIEAKQDPSEDRTLNE